MMLVLINTSSVPQFATYLHKMKAFEQRKYFNAIISFSATQYLGSFINNTHEPIQRSSTISDVASLILSLIKPSGFLKEHLVSVLTKSTIPALDDFLAARRSAIAAIADDEGVQAIYIEFVLLLTFCRSTPQPSRK